MTDTNNANVELLKAKLEAQRKDKLLHLVGGLFVGLIVGFFGANWMNASAVPPPGAQAAADEHAGHNHPPGEGHEGEVGAAGASGAAMPEVQAKLKVADENPQDYTAQLDAAAMFYRIQNYDRAITYLERARKLRPDDVETLVYLANTVYDARRFDQALPLYEEAVRKKPDDVNVRTDLGSTYFNLEQVDRAVETFRESLKVDPKHEKTLFNLTVALLHKGDAVGAEDALNRLAAVNPQNEGLAGLRADLSQLKTTGKIPTH
jgi:tetratricopeptide (TPR) repeat protein